MKPATRNIDKALQIGSARATIAFEHELPEQLRAILNDAGDSGNPEARLWRASGTLDVWTRAGYAPVPAPAATKEDPAAAESMDACPPRAEHQLTLLLQGMYPVLRAEWLRLAGTHRCRLPLRLLPGVLELGSKQQELRALIVPLLGARGAWLARQNRQWDWALADGGAGHLQLWQEGGAEQRTHALRTLRAADPAKALQLLQAGWAQEAPEQRAILLACLETGLSLADEAFLETALDDRRKEVRLAAQGLLARLSDSMLAERMRARLLPLLRVEPRTPLANHLVVTLPPAYDKAMARDGIGAATHRALGEKAGWLADMVASVPLQLWPQLFGLPVRDCIGLAGATDFAHALLRGWSLALQRQIDDCMPASSAMLGDWLDELTQAWLAADDAARQQYPAHFFAAWAKLPAADAEARLLRLVEASPQAWSGQDGALLDVLRQAARATPGNWASSLSLALMRRLQASVDTTGPHVWYLRQAMTDLGAVFDPACAAAVETGWSTQSPHWPDWQAPVEQLLNLLRFRHDLYSSFQELPQ